jgi:hypothetical protein
MTSFESLPQFPLPANPLALFGVLLLAAALTLEPLGPLAVQFALRSAGEAHQEDQ